MTQPSFTIRRGRPPDAAALADFGARAFADAFGPDNRPENIAAHLASTFGPSLQAAELADPDVITVLLESNGRLAAYAQVRRRPGPGCVRGEAPVELQRFYVDRPWHGKGLAQRLMAEVREAARELHGRMIWLSVWEKNPRAIAFYAKCGFRHVGSSYFWVGADRQNDRIMVADIAPGNRPAP